MRITGEITALSFPRSLILAVAAAVFAVVFLVGAPAPAMAKYAAIVIDAESGEVLHAKNANKRRHPASLTKIMTLYLLFDELEQGRMRLDQRLKVSRRAARQPRSKLGLRSGQTITVEDALQALVTKSANDVAVVVAEAISGTEAKFARKMTLKARELGMRRTTFRNASGLYNRGQLTTAADLATLSIALLRNHATYYHYFSRRSFTYRGVAHRNHNKLLTKFHGTDGIKTGYIRAAGFNLAASVTRNNRRLVAVVMGGRTGWRRDRHMMRLLDQGFAGKLNGKGNTLVASATPRTRVASATPRTRLKPEARARLRPEARPGSRILPITAVADIPTPDFEPTDPGAPPTFHEHDMAFKGHWDIQVGAFRKRQEAQSAAVTAKDSVPGLLNGARIVVEPAGSTSRSLYRARLRGMASDQAIQACKVLQQRDIPCFAMRSPISDCETAQGDTSSAAC
ncbi:MAG: D-alanyl-D-alanine carboxypeptidase family protein [Alphaproteobacteria bacterium]|nr:D-alanyl-D-alanine carboxypeptidase family protein [Alphaproteobacteria bacterium]